MRWSYLIPRLLVVLSLWGYMAFGFDPTVRLAGVFGLQSTTGRAVEIDRLQSSFWPPRFEVADVQIAAAERDDQAECVAERLRVELDEDALRHRKFVAELVTVEGVEWDVPAEFEADEAAEEEEASSAWAEALRERGRDALEHQLQALRERIEGQVDADRFETVQLAKVKRTEYEATAASLRTRAGELRRRADDYRAIATDPAVRRQLLLDVQRMEALVRDAKRIEDDVRALRDEIKTVKSRLPIDYRELNEAKDRDLAAAKADWDEFRSTPDEMTELLLGGPVASLIEQFETWWPRWQRFHDSGDWKRRHEAERRGRAIAFLPEHAGPDYGVRKLLVSGRTNLTAESVPFQLEMHDLTYPVLEDKPASFQWASRGVNGQVPDVQAAGFVRLHHGEPQVTLQFRVREQQPLVSINQLRGDGGVAFSSAPPTIEGSLTIGAGVHGECQLHFPDAKAEVRSGSAKYDAWLAALDVKMPLSPRLTFDVARADNGRMKPDYDLECESLGQIGDAWQDRLTQLGQQVAADLAARAEQKLVAQLDDVRARNSELDGLLSQLQNFDLKNVVRLPPAAEGLLPPKIRQTAGEKAAGLFDRLLR